MPTNPNICLNYEWHNHSRDFLQTQDILGEETNLEKDMEIITLLMNYTVSVRVHEKLYKRIKDIHGDKI